MNGLLGLARQPQGTLRFFSEETQQWSSLGVIPVHGYHSLARHNPFRQEVLFAGGYMSVAESPNGVIYVFGTRMSCVAFNEAWVKEGQAIK